MSRCRKRVRRPNPVSLKQTDKGAADPPAPKTGGSRIRKFCAEWDARNRIETKLEAGLRYVTETVALTLRAESRYRCGPDNWLVLFRQFKRAAPTLVRFYPNPNTDKREPEYIGDVPTRTYTVSGPGGPKGHLALLVQILRCLPKSPLIGSAPVVGVAGQPGGVYGVSMSAPVRIMLGNGAGEKWKRPRNNHDHTAADEKARLRGRGFAPDAPAMAREDAPYFTDRLPIVWTGTKPPKVPAPALKGSDDGTHSCRMGPVVAEVSPEANHPQTHYQNGGWNRFAWFAPIPHDVLPFVSDMNPLTVPDNGPLMAFAQDMSRFA